MAFVVGDLIRVRRRHVVDGMAVKCPKVKPRCMVVAVGQFVLLTVALKV